MDAKFEQKYREIFADLKVDRDEFGEISNYFNKVNPIPDKLVWLRAAAFRVGSEFLSRDGDSESDKSLLRCINVIVHALEQSRMVPKKHSDDEVVEVVESQYEDLYSSIFADLTVDDEENKELATFFSTHPLPTSKLIWARATAFRIGSTYLTNDRSRNISLLRCINVVIHNFEKIHLQPKPYKLHLTPPSTPSTTPAPPSKPRFNLHADIATAIQHLWDMDMNRLAPGADYVLNVQSGKKPYQKHDAAPDPLFTRVDRSVFRRSTYRTFVALLDNYCAAVGTAEVVTAAERRENWDFIDAIMQTAPMQFCHAYCCAKDKGVPRDDVGFKRMLYDLWFKLYNRKRGGRPDSSGFEHVFVGEIKDGKILGFHNWIRFYLEEKRGAVDYRGYIKPKGRGGAETNDDDYVLTLQFRWNGVEKFMGGGFIGVSPEFEMAIYTICFLLGEEDNEFDLDTGYDVFRMNIKCYKMGKGQIGTAFPEILEHHEE